MNGIKKVEFYMNNKNKKPLAFAKEAQKNIFFIFNCVTSRYNTHYI